jgi:hypothetical protein
MIEPNYIPSVQDALRVRLRSTGIEEATFKFGNHKEIDGEHK